MTPDSQHDIDSPESLRRREHGLEVLARIDGHAGQAVIDALAGISPALGHHVAAFAFGDIYDRPALDPRSRQLVTIGVLTALGIGLTREEIVEAILHASVYCGFPRALNATFAAKDVFSHRA